MKLKWFIRLLLLLTLVLGVYAIFSDGGLYDLWELKSGIRQTELKNNRLLQNKGKLAKEIHSLKYDNFYIEKIAREELGMTKKNEIIVYLKKNNGSRLPKSKSINTKNK